MESPQHKKQLRRQQQQHDTGWRPGVHGKRRRTHAFILCAANLDIRLVTALVINNELDGSGGGGRGRAGGAAVVGDDDLMFLTAPRPLTSGIPNERLSRKTLERESGKGCIFQLHPAEKGEIHCAARVVFFRLWRCTRCRHGIGRCFAKVRKYSRCDLACCYTLLLYTTACAVCA